MSHVDPKTSARHARREAENRNKSVLFICGINFVAPKAAFRVELRLAKSFDGSG
jgi:hypothetical protein